MGVRINQRVGGNTSVSVGLGWLVWPAAGLLGVALCGARTIAESRVAAAIFLLALISLIVYVGMKSFRKSNRTGQ